MFRPMWMVVSLALVLFSPFAAASGQSGNAPVSGERRTVIVGIVTDKGQLVNGLEKQNFRARLGKQDVPIVSVRYEPVPHRIVLLLDVSSSMDPDREVETWVAEKLLLWTSPWNPVAVLAFSNSIDTEIPFSTDRAAARAEIAKLKCPPQPIKHPPPRMTALLDALDRALEILQPAQPGDAIVLITDGGENRSKLRERQVKKIFGPSGQRIFTVLLWAAENPERRYMQGSEGPYTVASLSEDSGGRLAMIDMKPVHLLFGKNSAKHPEQAESARQAALAPVMVAAREINSFYRLEIELPAPIDKPRGWKLEVIDPATGRGDHHLLVDYPLRLYPIAPKSSDK